MISTIPAFFVRWGVTIGFWRCVLVVGACSGLVHYLCGFAVCCSLCLIAVTTSNVFVQNKRALRSSASTGLQVAFGCMSKRRHRLSHGPGEPCGGGGVRQIAEALQQVNAAAHRLERAAWWRHAGRRLQQAAKRVPPGVARTGRGSEFQKLQNRAGNRYNPQEECVVLPLHVVGDAACFLHYNTLQKM